MFEAAGLSRELLEAMSFVSILMIISARAAFIENPRPVAPALILYLQLDGTLGQPVVLDAMPAKSTAGSSPGLRPCSE